MLEDQRFFRDVVERTNFWTPSEDFEDAEEFSEELKQLLDEKINQGSLIGESDKIEITVVEAGIDIDGKVLVHVEKSFSGRERAYNEINGFIEEFDYIVFVACGVEDPEEWRTLERKYKGTRGREGEVEFIWKSPEFYGMEKETDRRGEDPLGGLMEEVTDQSPKS